MSRVSTAGTPCFLPGSAAVLIVAIALTTGGAGRARQNFAGNTLRIGFDDAPPYTIVAADGKPIGLAVELIDEAARRRGIQLQWIKVDEPGRAVEDRLTDNRVDLWPVVGITLARLEKIHIGRPWLENASFLVSRKADPVNSPEQAKGRRIIHVSGVLATELAHKLLDGSDLIPVPGFASLLGPVCRGEGDAAFMEGRTLETILLERAEDCARVPLKVASVPNAISHAGIGARREVAAQADALTDEIMSMAADGTFARAVDKWSSFSASETRSLLALQRARERDVLFNRGLWALTAVCLAMGGIAAFAFRARKVAEKAHANEASRAEILKQMARGAPLEEMAVLLASSLRQCCPRLDGTLILNGPVDISGDRAETAVWPIVDSRGARIGLLTVPIRTAELTRKEREAMESIGQLAAVVTEHRMLHSELQRQARQDRLTGLANRSVFAESINRLTSGTAGAEAMLFFLDLDRFKQVNDRFGHGAGDIYLRLAAERIRNCFSPEDLVARLGGDEFTALCVGMCAGDAGRICQSVIDAFSAPFEIEGFRIPGGVSIGVSAFPQDGRTPAELQRSADAALYDAKRQGRNRFRICSPRTTEWAGSIMRVERLIRRALDHQWLELFYQPQAESGGELAGMEALVRIRHPEQGLIAAADFIEIAENAGLVAEIDAWVLSEAMRQYAEWRRKGLEPLRIGVNISRVDGSHSEVFGRVMSALNKFGLGPEAVQIDLADGAAIVDCDSSTEMLRLLHRAGISLALVAGVRGCFTLDHLRHLPIDTLKIDKELVRDLSGETSSASRISATIAAARDMRMTVIAEGVETAEQMLSLRKLGCDVMQGYHIARPLNAAAAERVLIDRLKDRVAGSSELTALANGAASGGPLPVLQ